MTVEATAPAAPRRRRLARSARREQLLGAAREVFAAQGYHAAAMDAIAERGGVTKPVLYQHFPSKLDLYLALLDAAVEALLEDVRAALASTSDNRQRAAATVAAYFRFVEGDGAGFRLVFESDLTNEAGVRERTERLTEQCVSALSPLIAEESGLPAGDADLVAAGLVGTAQVAARYWLREGASIPREEAAGLVATLTWRGVRGLPRAGDGSS